MAEAEKEQTPEVKEEKKDEEQPLIKYNYEILPEDYTNFDLSFKLIVIGDSGVGKSSLTNNGIKKIFSESYNATVGFEFFTFNVKMNDKVVKLQIWDTCGQETYRSLISSFYRSSSLAILVYSIDSESSFNNLEMWLNEIKTKGNPDVNIILIGNKADLEDKRVVTKEMANEWCENNGVKTFMETSAKNGNNVKDLFLEAAKILLEQHKRQKNRLHITSSMKNVLDEAEIYDKNTSKEININDGENSVERRKKGCC